MEPVIHLLHAGDRQTADCDSEAFARDILEGLSADQKHLPASYHYDAEGSRLFDCITELPEYYLTRCESDALRSNRERIVSLLHSEPTNVIEFGPGDGSKTRTLIAHFLKREIEFRYVAVDISTSALELLADAYRSDFPDLPINCLAADYFTGLRWLKNRYQQRNLILFLGSSIGNFSRQETKSFLTSLRDGLNEGDLAIIGFDLAKDADLIRDAYNDSADITAAFNLNVLERINRELEGDFDISRFRYEGRYDKRERVVRSYLISLENQRARVGTLDRSFSFTRGETIHTEDSYKYSVADIENLAARSGFCVLENLYDSCRYFVDSIWRVQKA